MPAGWTRFGLLLEQREDQAPVGVIPSKESAVGNVEGERRLYVCSESRVRSEAATEFGISSSS